MKHVQTSGVIYPPPNARLSRAVYFRWTRRGVSLMRSNRRLKAWRGITQASRTRLSRLIPTPEILRGF